MAKPAPPTGQLSLFAFELQQAPERVIRWTNQLSKHDFFIQPVTRTVALDLVERYHYAQGGAITGVHFHGLFDRQYPHVCLGVAWWLPPLVTAAQWVERQEGAAWQRVLNLHRLVIAPGVPKNAATFLIGRSIRAIRRTGHTEALLTYADAGRGHRGTIYLAATGRTGVCPPHARAGRTLRGGSNPLSAARTP